MSTPSPPNPIAGDNSLDLAFDMFFKMVVSIPLDDLQAYPKLCSSFYKLLFSVTEQHIPYLAGLESDVFRFLANAIFQGIKNVDSKICNQSCKALDYLMTFVFDGLSKPRGGDETAVVISRIMSEFMDIFAQMLHDLLRLISLEHCENQWTVSRPLLPLILLQPAAFESVCIFLRTIPRFICLCSIFSPPPPSFQRQAQQQIVASFPPHRQAVVIEAFQAMMVDVERSVTLRNREQFTRVGPN